jgi:hypothetical protein
MADQQDTDRTLARTVVRLMVGSDIDRARQRMRNAWIAGFIWSALSFMGAVAGIWGLAPGAEQGTWLGLFIPVVLEVGLVAYFSYGVLQRRRWAATLLFFYFWISRIAWVVIGQISLQSGPQIAQFLVLHVLPAYLFFQGMRGAWTFSYLTHPQYPDIPRQRGPEVPTPEAAANEPMDRP